MKFLQVLFFLFSVLLHVFAKDMMRKSIVFDKNTPDVFYCPIHKPTGFDKLIVRYVNKYFYSPLHIKKFNLIQITNLIELSCA